jgi:hypothetical protein
MPTIDERLVQVTSKVDRAKKHMADLEREIRGFLDTNRYRVATKRDPRRPIYYVASVEASASADALIRRAARHYAPRI